MNSPSEMAVFRWKPAAWLRVAGTDAETFLQGQFTNDLRNATSEMAVYGLWLTVKGKVLADSFLLRARDDSAFWIGSYFSSATAIRERLESYIIADDVTIDDETNRWKAVTAFGSNEAPAFPGAISFRGRRDRTVHRELMYPLDQSTEVERLFQGARTLSANDMEARRIAAGIPAVPRDLGPGDLPNEAGLEVDAISYTKGCYLGQEVMARLKSMGQVRRRLLRVDGQGSAPPTLPAPLFTGGKQAGELRSAISVGDDGFIGLAMVSLLHAPPGTSVALAPDADPTLRLVEPK